MTEELFDKAPVGTFCFTDDGSLVLVNDTLCAVLKFSKEQLSGKSVEVIFTLSTRIFFQTHFFPLLKIQGHAEEIFVTLLTANQEHIPVLLNAKKIEWQGQAVNCCVFIVVQNRKKFEDELVAARNLAEKTLQDNSAMIRAKEELQQQSEELELQIRRTDMQNYELKQFSHIVTHNLKEPLRKIMMFTSMVREEFHSPSTEKLLRSANQMKTVISGLQQYVWLNEKINHFTEVNLNEALTRAMMLLGKDVAIDLVDLQTEQLASLEGDAEQLQMLLYHLLSNAVKFRRGNKAFIRISSTILKKNKFRSVEKRYQYESVVRLEVRDEGIGIDPAYKEQVFELFRKLHQEEGQGLGLALCKKIAQNHKGFITVESELNTYTRIIVWLPEKQSDVSKL